MKKNELITNTSTNTANTLRTLANAIEQGTIKEYSITQKNNSLNISIDSLDGEERIIKNTVEMNGYTRNSNELILRQTPEKRREIVKELKQEGFTQKEIAKRTMCSQKTISNDIKKLKDDNELE